MNYGNKRLRELYFGLPAVAKNFIATVYGYRLRRERYQENFRKNLEFLRESQFWSNEKLLEYQTRQVQKFLADVIENTQYYRKNKIYLDLLGENAALDNFPLLPKQTVRAAQKKFYHSQLKKMPHKFSHTSGTTGSALVFPVEIQHLQRDAAFRALHYEWGGISLDGREKVAFCAGHPVAHFDRNVPPFWVHDRANGWLYFSSYHLTERNLRLYIGELERFQPAMIGGYPSSIYLLARAFQKFGTRHWKIKSIFTSSETLLDFQRAAIENAFGTKVYNYYGNSEMCAHAAECERGEIHLKLEYSAVEILKEQNKFSGAGEETGRLVCTNFNNRAFALIRYEIGDAIKVAADQTAECGRGGVLLSEIVGRVEDYVLTPDGRFVGRLDHLFKDSLAVEEAQIIQNSLSEIVLRVVKTDDYDSTDERQILDEARLRLGNEIKIRFEYVSAIPRARNGKFRFIVSKINQTESLDALVN
jgi:phenylacetate-CoA ligase